MLRMLLPGSLVAFVSACSPAPPPLASAEPLFISGRWFNVTVTSLPGHSETAAAIPHSEVWPREKGPSQT